MEAEQELAEEQTVVTEEFAPVAVHHTKTADGTWDGPANEARLPSPMNVAIARAAYAWMDSSKVEK